MTDRRALTTWTGDLTRGTGTVTLESSGVGKFDVSWRRAQRIQTG